MLEKDRENRWQNARDLKAELEWIEQSGAKATVSLVQSFGSGRGHGSQQGCWAWWQQALAGSRIARRAPQN